MNTALNAALSTYIIGDLHGCCNALEKLLDKIKFDAANDRLWFVGDLVNRGPASLATLRLVKNLGSSATVVLGNHDIHFLAVYYGIRNSGAKDTLQDILDAPDVDALVQWLRTRPFLHHDKEQHTVMVHAGIPPVWDLKTAKKQAKKAHKRLASDDPVDFLSNVFSKSPDHWGNAHTAKRKRNYTVNALTRMRYCWSDGSMDFTFNGSPKARPQGLSAWYKAPNRIPISETIVFGHWAAHPAIAPQGIVPTDRGCVYGGSLVAYHLEEKRSIWVN